jgi:hypothetical protein
MELKMSFLKKLQSQYIEAATWVKGDKLSAKVQQEILNGYIYRWTKENHARAKALHEKLGSIPTIPLISDAQWLATHAFKVNKDGSLSKNVRHAMPHYMAD